MENGGRKVYRRKSFFDAKAFLLGVLVGVAASIITIFKIGGLV